MSRESLKVRIKRLEGRVPTGDSNAEELLALLKRTEDEGLKRPLTEAERADLKVFLDNYPYQAKWGDRVGKK